MRFSPALQCVDFKAGQKCGEGQAERGVVSLDFKIESGLLVAGDGGKVRRDHNLLRGGIEHPRGRPVRH
jgi:hypothetical protein